MKKIIIVVVIIILILSGYYFIIAPSFLTMQKNKISYMCDGTVKVVETGGQTGPTASDFYRVSDKARVAYCGDWGCYSTGDHFDREVMGGYGFDETEFCEALKK